MKGSQTIIVRMMLTAFVIVSGIIIIVIALAYAASATYTACWKDTIREWSTVKSDINSENPGEHDVTMRSECLESVKEVGKASCYEACDYIKGEKGSLLPSTGPFNEVKEAEECKAECDVCGREDIKTCWVAVPKIPSAWKVLWPVGWIDTIKERTHRLEVYSMQYKVRLSNGFPAVPKEGSTEHCAVIAEQNTGAETAYSLAFGVGRCV